MTRSEIEQIGEQFADFRESLRLDVADVAPGVVGSTRI